MKTIVIGDIHGRSVWKNILKEEKTFDKIIFLGDYLDSFDKTLPIAENLKEIVQFKRDNFDKVVLLFGNHDFHYLKTYNGFGYSGFNFENKYVYQNILNDMVDNGLIHVCHLDEYNNLFSHAGFTKTWCVDNDINPTKLNSFVESVDELFKTKPYMFDFRDHGLDHNGYPDYRGIGTALIQGPLWIRPQSLIYDKIDVVRQFVGHTHYEEPIIDGDGKVIFCDTLEYGTPHYVIIDNNQIKTKKLTIGENGK